MRERLLRHDAGIINQELRRKIVGAVNDKIVILDNVENVFARYESVISNYVHIRVHRFDRFFGRLNLGLTHILRVMYYLTLQIRKIDCVGIGNADRAHAGGGKVHGHRSAKATCTNDEYLRVQELLLAFYADIFKNNVARIPFQLFVGKSHFLLFESFDHTYFESVTTSSPLHV